MASRRTRWTSPALAAAVITTALFAAAVPAGAAQPGAGAARADAGALPAAADEARGTCRTPRQAWLQLLYWLQRGTRWEPERAAACFDAARVNEARAAELAVELKEALDANAWVIDVDDLPTDPAHLDPATGSAIYEAPAVEGEGIVLVKERGRWVFSAETLDRIPDLLGVSRDIARAMPAWLQTEVLEIAAWKYLGVVILVFVALALQRLATSLVGSYVRHLFVRAPLLQQAVHKADRPIGGLAVAATFYFGFPLLLFPVEVSRIALVASKAIGAYSLVWLGYRLIDVLAEWLGSKAAATDSKLDDQLVPLARKTLKIFATVVGGIFVLQNLDVDVSSLLAGLGLGGLAFALAAKDTLANFFGSVMIFIDKPFQIGDWVEVGEVQGIIEEVGFRTTKVRTFHDSLVTLPNATVVSAAVDNYGMREYRRYYTTLSLTYDTPPDKVQAFCEAVRAIIAGMPEMRKDFYLVEFTEFAESSLTVMIYSFIHTDSYNTEMRVRTRLNLEIMRAAERLGVSFAFPTRTLHVDSLVEPGTSRPAPDGPRGPEELATVIGAFGPAGELAQPGGFRLSRGYDCEPPSEGGPAPGVDDDE